VAKEILSLSKRMYSPSQKRTQRGGDFTDTVNGATISVSQSTMNMVGDLAHISSFAQMSSFIDFNALTPTQITTLLNILNVKIAADDTIITNDTSTINGYQLSIDAPVTGLQAIYDSTATSYSTSVINYNSSIDSLRTTMTLISTYTSTVCSLAILDDYQLSTVSHYDTEYSTIFLEIMGNTVLLASQTAEYNNLSTQMENYAVDYSTIFNKYDTEKHRTVTDSSLINQLSTSLADNLQNQTLLEPYLQSTFNNVSTLELYSTSYSNPLMTDEYFSTLQENTISTIYGYSTMKAELSSTINSYTALYSDSVQTTHSGLTSLTVNINNFYAKVMNNLTNQLVSYQYQIEEWSAFVGYIASSLIVQKGYIALELNGLAVSGALIVTDVSNNVTPITDLSITQAGIQTILDTINILDVSFNSILDLCTNEMLERKNFVNAYKNMAIIEGNVTANINTIADVAVSYTGYLGAASTAAGNVNSFLSQRLIAMAAIMAILNPQLTQVQKLLATVSYTIPDSVSTDNTPIDTDLTKYQIFTPLVIPGSTTTTATSVS